AAGRRAVEHDDVPRPLCLRRLESLRIEDADAHRVHEAVAGIRLVEDGGAAEVRDADGVAVAADAGDGALERVIRRAEPEAVEERDRARTHCDDVAEDAADPRRSALVRLDRRRMVVRLDLERHRRAFPEVEDAGVLARPLQHALAAGGQPLQKRRRVLVPAVLRPEEREDRELEVVRVAPEELVDPFGLPVGQPESAMERLFGDLSQVIHGNRGTRRPRRHVGGSVSRRYPALLAAVSLLWGASFLFIKVAVRELAPATLILGRLGLATIALAVVVPVLVGVRETVAEIRGNARWLVVVGLVNVAIPFWLLSWGETRIASGLASIIQGSVPIFNALAAFVFFREVRVTGLRLIGVAIGFVGVALLVGAQPHGKVLGALAVCGMAVCYAVGQLLAGRHLRPTPPLVVALASTAGATLAMLPAGIAEAPAHVWKGETFAAILVLGVV